MIAGPQEQPLGDSSLHLSSWSRNLYFALAGEVHKRRSDDRTWPLQGNNESYAVTDIPPMLVKGNWNVQFDHECVWYGEKLDKERELL